MSDNKNSQWLIDTLKQQGMLNDTELNLAETPQSPWYIKLLTALSGWLAALFLLGFVGLTFVSIFDSQAGLFIVGTLMIGAAFFLLSTSDSDFTEHLGLAVSLAGQIFIVIAVFLDGFKNDALVWGVLTLLQFGLTWIMPSFIHRTMSAYFATICLSMLMATLHLSAFFSAVVLLLVALLWLHEFSFGSHIKKFQAAGYGFLLGLIQFKTLILYTRNDQTWAQDSLPVVNPWIDEGLNVLVLLFIINHLVKHKNLLFMANHRWLYAALLVLVCVGTLFANGIASGILVLLVGFAIQNYKIWVLGIMAVLINLSSYYYLLDISLLHKSFILVGLGIVSLLLAYLFNVVAKQGVTNET